MIFQPGPRNPENEPLEASWEQFSSKGPEMLNMSLWSLPVLYPCFIVPCVLCYFLYPCYTVPRVLRYFLHPCYTVPCILRYFEPCGDGHTPSAGRYTVPCVLHYFLHLCYHNSSN